MSDRRTTRQERAGGSSDEHLREHDKQLERKTESEEHRRAMPGGAGNPRHGQPQYQEDEPRDRVDEASEESFPASDPPQQP